MTIVYTIAGIIVALYVGLAGLALFDLYTGDAVALQPHPYQAF